MRIKISKKPNPLADLFSEPLSVESDAEFQKLMFVEELLAIMEREGISRRELARRMGVQPSRITSMFTASNNFTIETMVRAGRAVGAALSLHLTPEKLKTRWIDFEDSFGQTFRPQAATQKFATPFTVTQTSSSDDAKAA